jgi:hypothetical protein
MILLKLYNIIQFNGSEYSCEFLDDIIMKLPISQASIGVERGVNLC